MSMYSFLRNGLRNVLLGTGIDIGVGPVASILTGTDDPTSVAQNAKKGSLYLRQGTAGVYYKNDDGSSTNWLLIPTGASGNWTPAFNYVSGITLSGSSLNVAYYSRLNNIVTIAVTVDFNTNNDPGTGIGATTFSMSLPIASDFTGSFNASGVVYFGAQTPSNTGSFPGYIYSDATSNLIYVTMYSYAKTTGLRCIVTGQYEIK